LVIQHNIDKPLKFKYALYIKYFIFYFNFYKSLDPILKIISLFGSSNFGENVTNFRNKLKNNFYTIIVMDVYKYGVPEIDNDPLCICLGKYLENPLYRNILKLEETSEYCMCLCDNSTWKAIPDSQAISEFVVKHIEAIYSQAITAYESLTENTKPEIKNNLETLIFIIQQILEGNELILVYVYDRVKRLLYHVTKRYNKDDVVVLNTKVYPERVTVPSNNAQNRKKKLNKNKKEEK